MSRKRLYEYPTGFFFIEDVKDATYYNADPSGKKEADKWYIQVDLGNGHTSIETDTEGEALNIVNDIKAQLKDYLNENQERYARWEKEAAAEHESKDNA